MTRYLTSDETATLTRRHPVTVRKALEAGELHGSQRTKGGRWTVREECAEAWVEGRLCAHQSENVVAIGGRRAAAR